MYDGRLLDCRHRILSILLLELIAGHVLSACLNIIAAICVDVSLSSCNGAIFIRDNLLGRNVALAYRILSLCDSHFYTIIPSLLFYAIADRDGLAYRLSSDSLFVVCHFLF